MVSNFEKKSEKLTLHYVDSDTRERARFAQLAMDIGYHCEVYDDLDELLAYPPRQGLIFLRDAAICKGGIVRCLGKLQYAGIWLSVIAVGEAPSPENIVEAIKGGALDYLTLPIEADRLERCLVRTAEEAERTSSLRRRQIEAQKLIDGLSAREAEVLELLAAGHSNKLIARDLGISPRTVEVHRASMMSKLGATHAANAVRMKLESEKLQFV